MPSIKVPVSFNYLLYHRFSVNKGHGVVDCLVQCLRKSILIISPKPCALTRRDSFGSRRWETSLNS